MHYGLAPPYGVMCKSAASNIHYLYIPVICNQDNLNNSNSEENKSDTTSRVTDHS